MASIVSVSVPIWLTLIRMLLAMPLVDALLQPRRVGDEQVVADELDLRAEPLGEQLPAFPVVFAAAVFDGADRVFLDPAGQQVDHAGGVDAICRPSSRPSSWRRTVRWRRRPTRYRPARRGPAYTRPCRRLRRSVPKLRRCCPGREQSPLRRPRPSCSPSSAAPSSGCGKSRTPQRMASLNESKPSGMTMNSCTSTSLSAWAPPLTMFIIGAGSSRAPTPPR